MTQLEDAQIYHAILTHEKFEDHSHEIRFQQPVYVSAIKVGAVPSTSLLDSPPFLNAFAKDLQHSDAARFSKLCDGILQPIAGNKVINLHEPILTDHVILRGHYHTVPITLLGKSLHELIQPTTTTGAEKHSTLIPAPISATEALERWSKTPPPAQPYAKTSNEHLQKAAKHIFSQETQDLLHRVLATWQAVAADDQRMHKTPLDGKLAKELAQAAEDVCNALITDQPLPSLVQHTIDSNAENSKKSDESLSNTTDWTDEALNMAMNWISLLGYKASGRVPEALEYAEAGLSAAILLCSNPDTALKFIQRFGFALLYDVLKVPAPQLPQGYTRRALACCLVCVKSCGAVGCEAALGWWKPKRLIWMVKTPQGSKQQQKRQTKSARSTKSPTPQPQVASAAEQQEENKRTHPQQADEQQPMDITITTEEETNNVPLVEKSSSPVPPPKPSKPLIPAQGEYDEYEDYAVDYDEDEDGHDVVIPQVDGAGDRWDPSTTDAAYNDDYIPMDEDHAQGYYYEEEERGGKARRESSRGGSGEKDKDRKKEREKKDKRKKESGGGTKRARSKDREKERKKEDRSTKDKDVKKTEEQQPAVVSLKSRHTRELEARERRVVDEKQHRSRSRGEKRPRSPSPPPSKQQHQPAGKRKEPESTARVSRKAAAAVGSDVPSPEERMWAELDIHHKAKSSAYWLAAEKGYAGIYPVVASLAVEQLQPAKTSAISHQILRLLRFYERAALASINAEKLASTLLYDGNDGVQQSHTMMHEVARTIAETSACLSGLAETLAAGITTSTSSRRNPSNNSADTHSKLKGPKEPESLLLEILDSRRMLQALCILLHVPATYAQQLLATTNKGSAAQASSSQNPSQAALAHQLSQGVKALISVLTSSASGLDYIRSDPHILPNIVKAVQPIESSSSLNNNPQQQTDVGAVLTSIAIAEAGIEELTSCPVASPGSIAALQTLENLMNAGEREKRVLILALARHSKEITPKLLQASAVYCRLLNMSSPPPAEESGKDTLEDDPDGRQDASNQEEKDALDDIDVDFEQLLDYGAACGRALNLLETLVTECGHADIATRLVESVPVVYATASRQLSSLDTCEAPGAARAVSALSAVVGGMQALGKVVADGLVGIMQLIASDLPMLLPLGLGSSAGLRRIQWQDAEEFFMDCQRLSRCSTSLRLLASFLWDFTGGLTAAAVAQYNDGLHVVLRAVLTALELVAAAQADKQWWKRGGIALDPAESSRARQQAMEFASLAAAVASVFLQQARSLVNINSVAMADALIRLHELLVTDEDSLVCMLGGENHRYGQPSTTNPGPVLEARYHAASALRCFIEKSGDWTPSIIPLIIQGTPPLGMDRVPANMGGLKPSQLLSVTCLLGDLFPTEWPQAGRRSTQAPPSHRNYRVALANGIQECQGAFHRLLADCCAAEPIVLRASAVRLLAKASGLGGGMGPFVIKPLVDALRAIPTPQCQVPVHDARRLLEMLVPLVYRPAIKAALLDSEIPSVLSQVLSVIVPRLKVPEESAEATVVCTMGMETLMVLCNPEIGLNPLAPKDVAAREEIPRISQTATVALFLIRHLPATGPNAPIGHRILRLLASSEHGRAAIRRAVVMFGASSTTTGLPPPPPPPGDTSIDPNTLAQSAQAVTNQYWTLAEQMGQAGDEGLKATFGDVVNIMQEICSSVKTDRVYDVVPSTERFKAALQAALAAAAAEGGVVEESRWEGIEVARNKVKALVFDPVTRMFWKNVKARAVQPSAASAALVLRRYARLECEADDTLSMVSMLHPPLTRPLRPRYEWVSAQGADISGHPAAAAARNQQQKQKQPGPPAAAVKQGTATSPIKQQQSPPAPSPLRASPLQHQRVGHSPISNKSPIQQQQQQPPRPSPSRAAVPVPVAIDTKPVVAARVPDLGDLDLYADLGFGEPVDKPIISVEKATNNVPATGAPKAAEAIAQDEQQHMEVDFEAEDDEFDVVVNEEEQINQPQEGVQLPVPEQPVVAEQKTSPIVEEEYEPAAVEVEATSPPLEEKPQEVKQEQQQLQGDVRPSGSTTAAGGGSGVSGLPTDPEALSALLQDPVKVQQMLEKNPQLLDILKKQLAGK